MNTLIPHKSFWVFICGIYILSDNLKARHTCSGRVCFIKTYVLKKQIHRFGTKEPFDNV